MVFRKSKKSKEKIFYSKKFNKFIIKTNKHDFDILARSICTDSYSKFSEINSQTFLFLK